MNHISKTAVEIFDELLGVLQHVKRTGDDKATARCPAHDDHSPSLTITRADDRVLVHCHAGCSYDAVLDALAWQPRDLFETDDAYRSDVARELVEERQADTDGTPLPENTPGRLIRWIDALRGVRNDPSAQLRCLQLIADSDEWGSLEVPLRCAVVDGARSRGARALVAAVLGRFDDRLLTWRDPPAGRPDGPAEPDVVPLTDLLVNVPASLTVARGLAFGGTMGFTRGPKGSGKTTLLAAAAARVSRGEPWADHPTVPGTVLVVASDDPRSWVLALKDYGADPARVLVTKARTASRRGRLAAMIAEHQPVWIIIDNLRTWCGALDLDTDSSSSAAAAIDPIGTAVRGAGYPVALTVVHNEARAKDTSTGYAGRMRNSTVFEDAADWIIGVTHVDGRTDTTIAAGEKTRRGIPTETLTIDLDAAGRGTASGADPFTVTGPVDPLDVAVRGYLMAHPEGVSLRTCRKAVPGRALAIDRRVQAIAERGADGLWRMAIGDTSGTFDALAGAENRGGGEPRDACVPEVRPTPRPIDGTRPDACVPPKADAGLGRTPGTHPRDALTPVLRFAQSSPNEGIHKACGRCAGTGLDAMGNICLLDGTRALLEGVLTRGTRYDEATKTWRPSTLEDIGKPGTVYLHHGRTVTDGDARVHQTTEDDEEKTQWMN